MRTPDVAADLHRIGHQRQLSPIGEESCEATGLDDVQTRAEPEVQPNEKGSLVAGVATEWELRLA
jgi:hypothetical protein